MDNPENFYCKECNYLCKKKSLWLQHLATQKHAKNTNQTLPNLCTTCGKTYKHRSGLWKHKIKCDEIYQNMEINNQKGIKKTLLELAEDVKKDRIVKDEMANQIKEQNKIIQEMIPHLGNNNNNQLNINVFLNETCKNAINMSDFINSLHIQLKDLLYTKDNGLIDGITTLFVSKLKELDVTNRPIHCTDMKKETLYVKENNEWEKEKGKDTLRVAINDAAFKHQLAIAEWERANPDWSKSDKGKDEYINLVRTVMMDISEGSIGENKIFKTLAKETVID